MSDTESGSKFEGNGQLVSHLGGDGQLIQSAETLGTMILGILCFLLLMALLRSQSRTPRLLEKQIESLQAQARK